MHENGGKDKCNGSKCGSEFPPAAFMALPLPPRDATSVPKKLCSWLCFAKLSL